MSNIKISQLPDAGDALSTDDIVVVRSGVTSRANPNFLTSADLGDYAELAGATFTGDVEVPDDAYDSDWNGSVKVPTRNAVYDKVETLLPLAGGTLTGTLTTNGQVAFPATQNASADANTLDDYEEGTWTPVITAATVGNLSVAYTTQVGQYIKIGKHVTVLFSLVTSTFTHTTASGNVQITGFPFTSATASGHNNVSSLTFQGINKASYTQFNVILGQANTTATIACAGSGVSRANLVIAEMPTGGSVQLYGSLTYQASA